ncbi:hypothetical protein P22_2937 [Propionispora sp. 2/2-37]|uniref:class I SAM-dependent methyltransferase n=1 Tax=Propionispora sp. 2/2-37 TaxID=1677858 RepID=UPI0006BB92E4|nr:class I SAM-dependent methyltransferase [Propionispora sp. 2/2-37]CUH96826.1 hypothetical protein P22_2937 [Propionispora sp. 2/2-37]
MNLLNRLNARIKEEGCSQTLKYVTLVCADALASYLRDTYLDIKYSGRVLHGNQASNYQQLGANEVYHTDYSVMPMLFSTVNIKPDDILVDVGCGKGRVINYWLSQRLPNQIIGLEIEPQIASATARQFAGHPNVKIIPGDAVANLPPDGTLFYFYNPFKQEKVAEFAQKLSDATGEKPVKVIYYNPKSLHVFENGQWSVERINFEEQFGIKRWGRLNKYHDLALITKAGNKPEQNRPRAVSSAPSRSETINCQ